MQQNNCLNEELNYFTGSDGVANRNGNPELEWKLFDLWFKICIFKRSAGFEIFVNFHWKNRFFAISGVPWDPLGSPVLPAFNVASIF